MPTMKERLASLRQYYVAFAAGGLGFATGTVAGWTNGSIGEKPDDMSDNWYYHSNIGFKVKGLYLFLIVISSNIGGTLASIPSGLFLDAVGRKPTLVLAFGPFVLGWLIVLAAKDAWFLCIGRCVLGAAATLASIVGPVYMTEIAHKQVRGIVSGLYKLQMTFGTLFVFILSAFLTSEILTVICVFVAMILIVPVLWLPETPAFLLWSNREEKAIKTLAWLRGKNYDTKAELDEIATYLRQLKQFKLQPLSFLYTLRRYSSLKALFLSFALICFSQMSGVNILIKFSTAVFAYGHVGFGPPAYCTIILGGVYCASTLVSILIVDRLGRRILLIISTVAIFLAFIVLGVYFTLELDNYSQWKALPLTCLSVTVIMFSLGLGTVPWIFISELFPPDVRGPAIALATTVYWLTGGLFTGGVICLSRYHNIGVTFWVLAAIQFFNFFFIFFLIPETRGKNSTEINEMLGTNKLK